ncbi:MAG TPA: hypothetical protein VL096_05970, partial [Pirellulaceae bacterium]|nr:hypothetical protein [Pirellulaceae bacterium]
MRAVIIMILSGILFAANACSVASAQAFRMETDVKIVGDKEATCQTLTLFSSGLVYDFLTTGKGEKEVKEVTVFDMNNQRIVLLDTKRCVKTVLTHEQLMQLTASLKAHTSEENPIFYFAANPNFEVKYDELGSQLTLASPLMTYVIKGVKPQATNATVNYQEFADWSARLNACRGNLPPFARMDVSRAMAERDLIPETITRTIVSPGKFG